MDNYIVFYIPDIEERVVTILRVMYSGRNIEEITIAEVNATRRIAFWNMKKRAVSVDHQLTYKNYRKGRLREIKI